MKRTTHWLYRHVDGSQTEEVWENEADSVEGVLALAHRDALAMAGGRELVALTRLEERTGAIASPPVDPLAAQRTLLAGHGLSTLPEPAAETTSLHVDWHANVSSTPWWTTRCAFGSGALAGLALLRCATHNESASARIDWVGECMAHQSSLYSVTPVALPFAVDLIVSRVPEWERLAEWLLVIADAAAEVGPESPEHAWLAIRDQLPPSLREAQEEAFKTHAAAAQAIQQRWPALSMRLEPSARSCDSVRQVLSTMRDFA